MTLLTTTPSIRLSLPLMQVIPLSVLCFLLRRMEIIGGTRPAPTLSVQAMALNLFPVSLKNL